jgi:transposase
MPAPYELWRGHCEDGDVLVGNGPRVLFRFSPQDRGMRNLAMVALSEAGVAGNKVAELFGVSAEHLSRLRSKVASHGSGALVPQMGAPRKLSKRQAARALRLAEEGLSGKEIAARFSVSEATVSRLLARERRSAVPQRLIEDDVAEEAVAEEAVAEEEGKGGHSAPVPEEPGSPAGEGPSSSSEEVEAEEAEAEEVEAEEAEGTRSSVAAPSRALARLGEAEVPSRYAGAMLLHPFLSRLGADEVLASLPPGAARNYDASSLVLASTFGFALGIGSLEGAKHLCQADAGALVALERFPDLRTLRPRLRALAASADPLGIQGAFAKAMLGADGAAPDLYYVDDHFVTYWGARPVGKGWNNRRHVAEPGRDDTFVVDDRWRAICFSSGEPRGLSVSLPEALVQLKDILGEHAAMVGFDRGGSYPKVFSAIAEAGWDWVTWRRAPLVAPRAEPRLGWAELGGKRRCLCLADELVELAGYDAGPVRQISAFEDDKVVFQVLSSNEALEAAPMVYKLKGRWCIENANKYLEANQGIHWLCSYEMHLEENTALVANPARKAARENLKKATDDLAEAERAFGAAMGKDHENGHDHASLIREARDGIAGAKDGIAEAKDALRGVPAKLPANSLDPNAKRAKPTLAARSLQMVCRLLAYNAELDLARRLNAYLDDLDEYRAITRNLLHLGGTIAYARREISVSLDRPDSPRVARALEELVQEINAGPPVHLAGDRRLVTYRMAAASG